MNTRAPRARATRARGPRAIAAAPALVLALALVACSNEQELADITTVAPAPSVTQPAATPAPTTDATDPTDSTDATDPSVDTTTETVPDTDATDAAETTGPGEPGLTGPMFSDALGVKVDSAPGVNTPGDTRQLLPEGLYVHLAWQADPNDPSVFTARPEDVEILEAYANAVSAYYDSATSDLRTDTDAMLQYLVDAEDMFGRAFSDAAAGNFVLDLGAGVTLRPYVTRQDSSSATVYDCYLDDAQYITRGSSRIDGTLAPVGQVATLVRTDGSWKVDTAGELGGACV